MVMPESNENTTAIRQRLHSKFKNALEVFLLRTTELSVLMALNSFLEIFPKIHLFGWSNFFGVK